MEDDKLGDWRIQAATTLAKSAPSLYTANVVHTAGTPVYLTTMTEDAKGNIVGFVTPSPVALALGIAIDAASKAKLLIKEIGLPEITTPVGPGKPVTTDCLPTLYDYFELCMTNVTFSFQAFETYSNQSIADKLNHPYLLERKDGTQEVSPEELQRVATTEEKLGKILPDILGTESPKGKRVWHQFKKLKTIRDTTIHLKSHDAYMKGEVDRGSLFYQFLHRRNEEYPSSRSR